MKYALAFVTSLISFSSFAGVPVQWGSLCGGCARSSSAARGACYSRCQQIANPDKKCEYIDDAHQDKRPACLAKAKAFKYLELSEANSKVIAIKSAECRHLSGLSESLKGLQLCPTPSAGSNQVDIILESIESNAVPAPLQTNVHLRTHKRGEVFSSLWKMLKSPNSQASFLIGDESSNDVAEVIFSEDIEAGQDDSTQFLYAGVQSVIIPVVYMDASFSPSATKYIVMGNVAGLACVRGEAKTHDEALQIARIMKCERYKDQPGSDDDGADEHLNLGTLRRVGK